MVESHANLDLVFAESFSMSLAAVSKHLRVLERAGLLARRRDGRAHHLRARPQAAASAHAWITEYARGWSDGLDALQRHLDAEHGDQRVADPRAPRTKKKGRNHDG